MLAHGLIEDGIATGFEDAVDIIDRVTAEERMELEAADKKAAKRSAKKREVEEQKLKKKK